MINTFIGHKQLKLAYNGINSHQAANQVHKHAMNMINNHPEPANQGHKQPLNTIHKHHKHERNEAIMSLYEVGDDPETLTTFDIQPKPLTKDEMEVLEHIVKDCTFKNKAYALGLSASEAKKSTIIDAFMVGAMQFYKSEMLLLQQYPMSGQRGHGPVDFVVFDRKLQTQVLGVTQVRKGDHAQGLAQNMVQLDVAIQNKRERAEEAEKEVDERAPVRFKSFGIVTDSFKWVIVECTDERKFWNIFR